MNAPTPSPDALRAALLEQCRLAGWPPRHLGLAPQQPGLEEALLEVIACREAGATQLSLELIDGCEQLGWQSPWLADNRARVLVHQGRDPEACAIWAALAEHPDAGVAAIAQDTLAALAQRAALPLLIRRIRMLREAERPEAWEPLLLEALLQQPGEGHSELNELLDELALSGYGASPVADDAGLRRHGVLLALHEQLLRQGEQQAPGPR